MTITDRWLNFLICPACKTGELEVREDKLVCKNCGRQYTIIEGDIPILLVHRRDINEVIDHVKRLLGFKLKEQR